MSNRDPWAQSLRKKYFYVLPDLFDSTGTSMGFMHRGHLTDFPDASVFAFKVAPQWEQRNSIGNSLSMKMTPSQKQMNKFGRGNRLDEDAAARRVPGKTKRSRKSAVDNEEDVLCKKRGTIEFHSMKCATGVAYVISKSRSKGLEQDVRADQ
jgi:hypothetical protein